MNMQVSSPFMNLGCVELMWQGRIPYLHGKHGLRLARIRKFVRCLGVGHVVDALETIH
jgi:hypothetical protein